MRLKITARATSITVIATNLSKKDQKVANKVQATKAVTPSKNHFQVMNRKQPQKENLSKIKK